MSLYTFKQSISPLNVIRGSKAWSQGISLIPSICKKPILIGRSKSTNNIRKNIDNDLRNLGLNVVLAELHYDCCEIDLDRLKKIVILNKCDGVIAAGGGKVLDSGKLIANRLDLPCITIPTSAATCAGWTALSNIYSPEGAFIKDEVLNSCPELFIFDHDFARQAPPRTLASGIADALAKWYEASIASRGSDDGMIQQAVQMARVLRDQLFICGQKGFSDPSSAEWVTVAEGCALTAGLIGGIGGIRCRTAVAHAVHNGLTQLKPSKRFMHGELVGFGILVQLKLQEMIEDNHLAKQSISQLIPLLRDLQIPLSLDDLSLNELTLRELKEACSFACNEKSDIHYLPFSVNSEILFHALVETRQSVKSTDIYNLKKNSKLQSFL